LKEFSNEDLFIELRIFTLLKTLNIYILFYGDWGLGIGDWAQSPIPNPQSPIVY